MDDEEYEAAVSLNHVHHAVLRLYQYVHVQCNIIHVSQLLTRTCTVVLVRLVPRRSQFFNACDSQKLRESVMYVANPLSH